MFSRSVSQAGGFCSLSLIVKVHRITGKDGTRTCRTCVSVHVGNPTVVKEREHKPTGGGGHSPATTGKVNLFNINSGSGHHADYATITILCSAVKDRPRPSHAPHTHTFHTPVLTRLFGIKTPREGALSAPYTDTHKHLLTQSYAITIRYNGLSTHPGTPVPPRPPPVQIHADIIEG